MRYRRADPLRRREGHGELAEQAYGAEQRNDAARDEPHTDMPPSSFSAFEPCHTECGEHREAEGDHEEDHPWGTSLFDHRHNGPPEMVERRRTTERDQQEQQPDATQPPHQAAATIAESKNRERDDGKSEVFGVELERVGSPVTAAERVARKARDEELRDVVPGDPERR